MPGGWQLPAVPSPLFLKLQCLRLVEALGGTEWQDCDPQLLAKGRAGALYSPGQGLFESPLL